jgi:nitrate/nitrite-specific signal transduction histidine kinase
MTVHVALAEASDRLSRDIQTELLRIAQEAITNVRKHARASNLWVTLNTNGAVALLRIEDDGVGRAKLRQDHFGLRMMRERADRIGAELAVTDRTHGGTSVVVALQPQHITTSGGPRADLSTAR